MRVWRTLGWIWCALMTVGVLIVIVDGRFGVAAFYALSAVLAAPPSWHVLARYGVRATRPIKALAVVGAYGLGAIQAAATFSAPKGASQPVASPAKTIATIAEGPANCDGLKAAPRDYAVRTDAALRERADNQAKQVVIPIGVDRTPTPVSIDTTMPVREMCRSGKWSYVAILQLPSDIGKGKGWTPTANLRPVKTDKSGRRIYGPADFEWPNGSLRYQKAILTVLNRVMVQNPNCDAFNDQSILMDKDRAGPLIKVACFGEPEQIVDFRPDDATNGRSFAPVNPIEKTTAREACWNAANERATHPSTVDISTFGEEYHSDERGGASYYTTFTAKNAFNLTLKYTIWCSFKGNEFAGVEIQETAE